MQGITCGCFPRPLSLKVLATRLKKYQLNPEMSVDDPKMLKEYFCYWKAKEFLEAEPDIKNGNTILTLTGIEEECKRRGFQTKTNKQKSCLHLYPFSLGEVNVENDLVFYFYGNSNIMPLPKNAPLDAIFDVLERLDKYLTESLSTEWIEIERRAAKLVKKAQLEQLRDKAFRGLLPLITKVI